MCNDCNYQSRKCFDKLTEPSYPELPVCQVLECQVTLCAVTMLHGSPSSLLLHRRQTELAQLGYPVLPMCQLSKSLFASHDTTINQTPATLSEGTSSPEDAIGPEGSAAQQGMEEEDSWQEEDQEGMSDQASTPGWQAEFERWLNEHSFSFDDTTFVLKPAGAGAGEDVWLINNLEMLQRRAQHIFSQASVVCTACT